MHTDPENRPDRGTPLPTDRRSDRAAARAAASVQPGFRLGRVFGVEVRVDWSLAFIFWLIAFNLGAGLFPLQHPEWSPLQSWALALVAAVLFFASVLAHELAHALVGRAQGIPVEGITLFIFGGVARLLGEPKSARAEFLMAAVGPLASLVIGCGALMLGLALAGDTGATTPVQMIQRMGPGATLLLWLGPVNITLAVFNLLPGFPLDGGRVLRALLWKATGDVRKATRWASNVGRVIALALVFSGVMMVFGGRVPYLGGGMVQGLWLIFIGWFLNNAAVQSYQQVIVRELLGDVNVGRLMRPDVATVTPELPVAALVDQFLMKGDQRCFPVVANENFYGLVCLSDVRKLPRDEWTRRSVGDIMTTVDTLSTVAPGEHVAEALRKLTTRDVDQVPVVEDGHLRGILRRSDILRWVELQSA